MTLVSWQIIKPVMLLVSENCRLFGVKIPMFTSDVDLQTGCRVGGAGRIKNRQHEIPLYIIRTGKTLDSRD